MSVGRNARAVNISHFVFLQLLVSGAGGSMKQVTLNSKLDLHRAVGSFKRCRDRGEDASYVTR